MDRIRKVKAFVQSLGKGLLGIFSEVILAVVFILAGFLVSFIWWSVAR